MERQYNYDVIPDSVYVINDAGVDLLESTIDGFRSGLGVNVVWDNRDNLLNPRKGAFADIGSVFYRDYLGSDFNYSNLRMDVRKYWNPFKNHTFAIRGNTYWTFASAGEVPIRGLSRVGGGDLIRGYFRGTFQDRNLISFESEYRLPFWKDDVDAPISKFWKRMGMVFFVSGAQVYGDIESLDIGELNYAVGSGLRILFNKESRLNLRIDYAFGLSPDSNGPGSRQTGLYFFLAEAF